MTDGRGTRVCLAIFLLAVGMAACSKTSDAPAYSPPTAAVVDHFGPGFAQAFRASPDSAPIIPSAASVIPVDPDGKPVPVR